MEKFSDYISPKEWCADLEAMLTLRDATDSSRKKLLAERHPNAPWMAEYVSRLRAANDYFATNLPAWKKAGFLTDELILKGRYLLFAFYGHFVMQDIGTVLRVDPPTDMFVWGANRAKKDEDERKGKE